VAGTASNCDTARFGWVLVLPVTASRGNQVPTIFFNQLDDLTNLHCRWPALSRSGMRQAMQLALAPVYHCLRASAKQFSRERSPLTNCPRTTAVGPAVERLLRLLLALGSRGTAVASHAQLRDSATRRLCTGSLRSRQLLITAPVLKSNRGVSQGQPLSARLGEPQPSGRLWRRLAR
jgi:hypothetical protein